MGVIILNGKSSSEYGILVEIPPNYESAERAYDVQTVPGRGEVLLDLGYYNNVEREYNIAIAEENGDFSVLAPRLSEWVNSGIGNVRIEDSYQPEQFVIGRIINPLTVTNIYNQAGRVTLTVNRLPERWLKSGEEPIMLHHQDKSIYNPTNQHSKPMISVWGDGDGVVTINDQKIQLKGIMGELLLDCQNEQALEDGKYVNNKVTLDDDNFPTLRPGENTFSFDGNIDYIIVTPRWWTL